MPYLLDSEVSDKLKVKVVDCRLCLQGEILHTLIKLVADLVDEVLGEKIKLLFLMGFVKKIIGCVFQYFLFFLMVLSLLFLDDCRMRGELGGLCTIAWL